MEFVEKYSIEKLTPWENNPRDNEIAAERPGLFFCCEFFGREQCKLKR